MIFLSAPELRKQNIRIRWVNYPVFALQLLYICVQYSSSIVSILKTVEYMQVDERSDHIYLFQLRVLSVSEMGKRTNGQKDTTNLKQKETFFSG